MRGPRATLGFILAIGLISGPAVSQEAPCAAVYTDEIKQRIVIPELKRLFAEDYVYFDYEKPVVQRKGRALEIWLHALGEVDGRILMFEGAIVVEVDACTKHLIKTERRTYGPFR